MDIAFKDMYMPRKSIYIDWNIFQDIKKERRSEDFTNKINEAKKAGFIFPYSSAHLRDLSRCKEQKYINEDLDFINEFTSRRCIAFAETKENIYFHQLVRNSHDNWNDFIKSEIDSNNTFTHQKWESPNINPFPVDFKKIDKNSLIYSILEQNNFIMCKKTMDDFLNTLKDRIFSDHKIQKNFRNSLAQVIGINNPSVEQMKDLPFYKFFLLDEEIIIKNLNDIFNSFLMISKLTSNMLKMGDKLTRIYNMISMFPSLYEKINKKNTILNSTTDAEHLMFASSSKYFICRDAGLIKKGSIVFKHLGIRTKIIDDESFISKLHF